MKVKFSTVPKEELIPDGSPSRQNLTLGNVYRVIGLEIDDVRIMNDYGNPVLYPLSWFSIVDSQWPDDWIVTVGTDGERYISPKVLFENYFWERYFDGEKEAVQALKKRLREWDKHEK